MDRLGGRQVYGRQLPSDPEGVSFRYQMDWVYGRMQRMTKKPFIVCEFGTIEDPQQAAWTNGALSDLVGGRWPKVIGFSWWNATFKNDPVTGPPVEHANPAPSPTPWSGRLRRVWRRSPVTHRASPAPNCASCWQRTTPSTGNWPSGCWRSTATRSRWPTTDGRLWLRWRTASSTWC